MSWRPEHRFLCACARRVPASEIRVPSSAEPFGWGGFLRAADEHAVTELLLTSLARSQGSVPDWVMSVLQRRALEVAASNLALTAQLAELVGRLRAHRIRALAFKGPTLAAGVYGDLGRRASGDLDVLVDRRDAARVRPLLLADGYVLPARRRHRGGSLVYGLYPPAGREDILLPVRPGWVAVEVHVGFAFWTQGLRLDVDGLFDRAVTVRIAGQKIPTLCPDDLLLVLAIHGMMHGWRWLRFVSDIDALAPCVADWDAIVHRARSSRMVRTLRVALLLAHRLLDTDLPARVLACAAEDRDAVALARNVEARLFAPPAASWDPEPWFLAFQERRRDRIRYHARRVTYEWFLKWPWDEWLGRRSIPESGRRA